jgi:HNH endonuclease
LWYRLHMAPPKRPLEIRFWEKVEKADGCWSWLGSRGPKGYGQLWSGGTFLRAHRVSWMLHVGPIPDGMWVLHHCDNPPCVRPGHLYLGTARENSADRERRKRHAHKVHRSLTWRQAEEIRDARRRGVPLKSLAEKYGVSKGTISQITNFVIYAKE